MKSKTLLMFFLIFVTCSFTAPKVLAIPSDILANTNSGIRRPTDRKYREIAIYIANRILALKAKVAGFESISRAKNVRVAIYPFRPVVDYRYRVLRYVTVPDAQESIMQPVYAEGGFSLTVWMVKGELGYLKREEPPIEIGSYKIVVDVSEQQLDRVKPIIDRIVLEAASHFNRKAQSNKSLQPTPRQRAFHR